MAHSKLHVEDADPIGRGGLGCLGLIVVGVLALLVLVALGERRAKESAAPSPLWLSLARRWPARPRR